MKNILSYIPGYRTKKAWKMIIASIYYIYSLIMLTAGFGAFLFFISAPFVVFSVIDAVRDKTPKYLIVSLIGIILMITGLVITPTSETSTEHLPSPSPTISVTEAPATEAPTTVPTSEPTPEPTAEPTEAPTQQPVATEPPALETQAVEQPSSGDTRMVWVGETGTKYHHEDCPSLKGKGHQITMEEALAEGRGPCGICYR